MYPAFVMSCLLTAAAYLWVPVHKHEKLANALPVVVCPVINGYIIASNVPCEPYEVGQAIFIGSVTGGVQPVITDWDKVSTPWNDDFGIFENSIGLANVSHGEYYFIARDILGCADTLAFTIHLTAAPTYGLDIIPATCMGEDGSINLYNLVAPPADHYYDWDWSGTSENDDYGSPPNTDDPQHIEGLAAGDYYLTFTVADYEGDPPYACSYYDTISVPVRNHWDGSESIEWENPANWSCNQVPDNQTAAWIPNGVPNFPLVKSNAFCCRLDVRPGATLIVAPGWSMTVDEIND